MSVAVDRVKQLIATLFDGIAKRVECELNLHERIAQETRDEEQRHAVEAEQRTLRHENERSTIQKEYDDICAEAGRHYQANYSAASEEYDEQLKATNGDHETDSEAARTEFEETRWMVTSYFDENAGGSPKQQFEQFEHNIEKSSEHLDTESKDLDAEHEKSVALLKKRRMWTEPELPGTTRLASSADALVEQFDQLSEAVREAGKKLRRKRLSLLFAGPLPVVVFLMMGGGLLALMHVDADPSWLRLNDPPTHEWLAILGGVSAVFTMIVMGIMFAVSRSGCETGYLELAQALVDARASQHQWSRLTTRDMAKRKKEFDAWYSRLVEERDSRLLKAQTIYDARTAELNERRREGLEQAHGRYPALMESITAERDQALQAAHDAYPARLDKLKGRYDWDTEKLQKEHEQAQDGIQQRFEFDWQNMAQAWHGVVDSIQQSSDRMTAEAARISQVWPDLAFGNWSPPEQIPPGVRIGQFHLRLADIDYGVPDDAQLVPEHTDFSIPALLPFPEKTSLIIRSSGGEGREASVDLLQVVMLRLLTTLPPGKLRFTIIDPIGLGENFSAFMHLADYDELLVTSRIWTENSHIELRLTDLTAHMETVFQTYLRNEFKTIEEYNDFAGEVAEPYHILVVAGFPASFSEQAARRLTSIMSSGPRCGVYTLLSVDPQLSMPPDFRLEDAEYEATCLTWADDAFMFDDEEIAWLPLEVHSAPEPDEFSRIVKRVGDASKDARRVEVAFERIAPTELWQQDSRGGLDVPLGRAGATKLQHMRLGKGTSQHMLIAGKTGSGKSTLMHILVTNLALHYSPNEIEFYLIDFKKGVEFKTYASNRLPHARVIAIESDREFGLSVLQRLDSILKERGDLFRDRGVQDITGFRNSNPERMPRIMLMIDEFQEFFTEDDRISQNSTLLLDRLVRQGRAFGMHVMLGSQTLGGAYSLARSTLGQVAVRIALQCSEADAHLILSEENTAARLLTRPGEALYNDANGLLEGNHPFQIAWLDDDKRDVLLQRIDERTREEAIQTEPAIVFEGNIPAAPLNNPHLVELFSPDRSRDNDPNRIIDVWLGEAVAIKPHSAIRFHRLSGSHLLLIGQSPISARGILSTVFLAAIGQIEPRAVEFTQIPADAVLMEDEDTDDIDESDTSATSESPSMDDALAAMKSFSFSDMKIDKPQPPGSGTERDAEDSAIQKSAGVAQFYVLDGELADTPDREFWSELASPLPHDIRVGGPRDAARFVSDLAALITARADDDSQPPVFLFIDNLGRFRDIRKSDDEYSFGARREEQETPAQQFVRILKDGPPVGVHCVVWADTFNNASRWMSNPTLRELEMRVAFQMSATDSSNFIESPVAGKLGQNRAILYLEEDGSHEKFRPYGLPSDDWLELVHQGLPNLSVPEPEIPEPSDSDAPVEVADDLSSWTVT